MLRKISILICLAAFFLVNTATDTPHLYSQECRGYRNYRNAAENMYVFLTPSGHEYGYICPKRESNATANFVYSVIFDNNGTPENIYDDIIINWYQ